MCWKNFDLKRTAINWKWINKHISFNLQLIWIQNEGTKFFFVLMFTEKCLFFFQHLNCISYLQMNSIMDGFDFQINLAFWLNLVNVNKHKHFQLKTKTLLITIERNQSKYLIIIHMMIRNKLFWKITKHFVLISIKSKFEYIRSLKSIENNNNVYTYLEFEPFWFDPNVIWVLKLIIIFFAKNSMASWFSAQTPEGKTYFFNPTTKETTWYV